MKLTESLQEILSCGPTPCGSQHWARVSAALLADLPGWFHRLADLEVAGGLWEAVGEARAAARPVALRFAMPDRDPTGRLRDGTARNFMAARLMCLLDELRARPGWRGVMFAEVARLRAEAGAARTRALRFLERQLVCGWWFGRVSRGRPARLADARVLEEVGVPRHDHRPMAAQRDFVAAFQAILDELNREYALFLRCATCTQSADAECQRHRPRFRAFGAVPDLVRRLILTKLNATDLTSLRATSRSMRCMVDNSVGPFPEDSAYPRALTFVDGDCIHWLNEYPTRHTPRRRSVLALGAFVPLTRLYAAHWLRAAPRTAAQWAFVAAARVAQLEVGGVGGADELHALLRQLAAHGAPHLQRVVLHRAAPEPAAAAAALRRLRAPPGFLVRTLAPALLVLQRAP